MTLPENTQGAESKDALPNDMNRTTEPMKYVCEGCRMRRTQQKNNSTPDKHVVKAAARGRWREILIATGIDPDALTGKHVACPGCGGKDRFRFDDRGGDGTFICSQGTGKILAGDGIALLMHRWNLSFPLALRLAAKHVGLDHSDIVPVQHERPRTSARIVTPQDDVLARQQVARILSQCQPITRDGPVGKYLQTRGLGPILDDLPQGLHEAKALAYYENSLRVGVFPAMIAEVRGVDGELVCLERVYLSPSGESKAAVSEPKKRTRVARPGATIGSAIRLYEADGRVALTEGIESALAVRLMTDWPVWACGSSQSLRSVELPASVEAVQIWFDRDKAGCAAAADCANWLKAENRCVNLIGPSEIDMDPLDTWHQLVQEAAKQG